MNSHQLRRAVRHLGNPPQGFRIRQGTVMAVNISGPTGQTIDVQVGGSSVTTPAVPYMLPATPVVGQGVWLITDGRDLFAFGAFGPAAALAFPYGAGFGDASGFHTGGYYLDASGVVHLTGVAQATATATAPKTIGTLPAGFRPSATQRFTVYATTSPCVVDVLATGVVQLQTSQANGNGISLTQISYLAEA